VNEAVDPMQPARWQRTAATARRDTMSVTRPRVSALATFPSRTHIGAGPTASPRARGVDHNRRATAAARPVAAADGQLSVTPEGATPWLPMTRSQRSGSGAKPRRQRGALLTSGTVHCGRCVHKPVHERPPPSARDAMHATVEANVSGPVQIRPAGYSSTDQEVGGSNPSGRAHSEPRILGQITLSVQKVS
jgi:hypothetical protein